MKLQRNDSNLSTRSRESCQRSIYHRDIADLWAEIQITNVVFLEEQESFLACQTEQLYELMKLIIFIFIVIDDPTNIK